MCTSAWAYSLGGATVISVFSARAIEGITTSFSVRGYTQAVITARTPGPGLHFRSSPGLGPGPTPGAPNHWKSDIHIKNLNTQAVRSPLAKFERENIEMAAVKKRACQCTDGLTGNAMQNGQTAEIYST